MLYLNLKTWQIVAFKQNNTGSRNIGIHWMENKHVPINKSNVSKAEKIELWNAESAPCEKKNKKLDDYMYDKQIFKMVLYLNNFNVHNANSQNLVWQQPIHTDGLLA